MGDEIAGCNAEPGEGTVTVSLPVDLLIELAILIGGMGGMWAVMRAQIADLRRQIDAHGPDVRKINPLETRFDGFRDEVERRLGGIERKVDEVHTLLLRAAAGVKAS
jgi:hypothetical protein